MNKYRVGDKNTVVHIVSADTCYIDEKIAQFYVIGPDGRKDLVAAFPQYAYAMEIRDDAKKDL